MDGSLSANTKAVLLLTAPLMAGQDGSSSDLLSPALYNNLARFLREHLLQPADLLGSSAKEILEKCHSLLEISRMERLLARGFALSQAIENWQARGIWVYSRGDDSYPKRFKERLKDKAPPLIYGCGETSLLDAGGLAVVGSRKASEPLLQFAENAGRLTATSGFPLISGGARGIDQAAMRGALETGGRVVGVLADNLGRAVLAREHRDAILDGRLVLSSPYDPGAGFQVGNAMQRNKLIYALADGALVVNADFQKGGTWAGAVEQLEKWKWIPLYIRTGDPSGDGMEALRRKGAFPWPNPETGEDLQRVLLVRNSPEQAHLFSFHEEPAQVYGASSEPGVPGEPMKQSDHDRRVDYLEFTVPDIIIAKDFFGRVFGWEFSDYGPDYTSFFDGRLRGGFRKGLAGGSGNALVVLYAADLHEIEAQVVAAGGRITVPIFEFPGGKRFHFAAPCGLELAIWSDR